MTNERSGQESENGYFALPADSGLASPGEKAALSAHLVSPASLFENPDPLPPPPPKEKKKKKRRCDFRWRWEVGSLFISLLAFISITIILQAYDGRSLSDWRGGPVTINAVIAVMSAIFRGFLVLPLCRGIAQLKWVSFANSEQSFANLDTYDQASRGAWGSFVLIKRQFTGEKLSPIAVLGAVIAILMLITEPFSQAAVTTVMRERVATGLASIARANAFGDSTRSGANIYELSRGCQLAALRGLYDNFKNTSVLMQPDITCPSGNCTFQQPVSMQTISMCHTCLDVTSKLRMSTNLSDTSSIDGYDRGNFTISNSPSLRSGAALATNMSGFGHFPDGPWTYTDIASFQGIASIYNDSACALDQKSCTRSFLGFDCALRPCVRTYSSSMTSGQYSEKEIKTEYLHMTPNRDFEVALNETFINGTWDKCTSSKTRSDTHKAQVYLPYQILPNGTADNPTTVWYPDECVYGVPFGEYIGLYQFLYPLFTQGQLLWGDTANTITGDAWLKTLYNNGAPSMDIANQFAGNLANSLGVYMRNNGLKFTYRGLIPDSTSYNTKEDLPPSAFKITGDMQHLEPCIKARWRFLSFLAVLFVLVIVFFLAVLWVDHRSRLWHADWKSATLPMMFQALQDKPRDSGVGMEREKYYTEAQSLRVRLVEGEKGWVFASGRDKEQ